jgi:hypothetical protein
MKKNIDKVFSKVIRTHYIIILTCGVLLCLFFLIAYFAIPYITINQEPIPDGVNEITLVAAGVICIYLVLIPLWRLIARPWNQALEKAESIYEITDRDAYIEYKTAEHIGKIIIGQHFTFIKQIIKFDIIPNCNIIWIYKKNTTKTLTKTTYTSKRKLDELSRRERYSVVIRTINKKEYIVPVYKEEYADSIVDSYAHELHVLLGYDNEYMKLYKYHFKDFLDIQYNSHAPSAGLPIK